MIDWRHWHNEPYLIGGLVLLGWLYAILAGPLRPRLAPGAPYPAAKAASFFTSLMLFYVAVGSPLDQIGERFLFSAHMAQHQVLVYPAALLFLVGLPAWMIDPLLGRTPVRRLGRFLTAPLVAGIIYTLVVSLWHFPLLYEWGLQNKWAHILEHVMFFAAALLFWWPIASPSRVLPAASYATQMLYVFCMVIAMIPVSAYLVFSDYVLYPTYEFAPRIVDGFAPAEDQLLAGTMMELGGMVVAAVCFTWSFFRWYHAGESADAAKKKADLAARP